MLSEESNGNDELAVDCGKTYEFGPTGGVNYQEEYFISVKEFGCVTHTLADEKSKDFLLGEATGTFDGGAMSSESIVKSFTSSEL